MTEVSPLKIIPLGGLGEVGLNLMALECGEDILLIDCGVLFPDLSWLGLDLVIPDFNYLVQNKDKVKALVISHGHEDHIGAIPFLLREIKVPIVYASRFASRLIEEKCSEHGVAEGLVTHNVQAGDKINAGCFECEFIHVTHSTLESFALSIKTPHGLVIHSGDFKFDETPYSGAASDKKRFQELGEEQPLLLLSDSTNSERCGHSKSESSITDELDRLVGEATGTIVVALFASNVHRVHQLMDIAEKHGRKIFLSGRSMERYVQIAIEQNHLPQKGSLIQPLEEIDRFDKKRVMVLSTGSQGEARSSLFRLAKNESRWLKIGPGDTVILSSRNIPGNERAINFVINQIFKLGAIVHYEDMKPVHASGHAYQEEQTELLKMLRPKYFIPIHGEYRQLALHKKTAEDSGYLKRHVSLIENGQVWEYDGTEARTDKTVVTGRKWFFQGNIGDIDDERIKKRRAAAKSGVITVICPVTKSGTQLERDVQVSLTSFLGDDKLNLKLQEDIQRQCQQAFEAWTPYRNLHTAEDITREQAVAMAARRVFKKAFDQKPLVIVHFLK